MRDLPACKNLTSKPPTRVSPSARSQTPAISLRCRNPAPAKQGMGKLPPNTYNTMRTVTEGKPKRTLVLLIRKSQVRILLGVLTYDDVCPGLCPFGSQSTVFHGSCGILLDRVAQVIFLCGAEVGMPHHLPAADIISRHSLSCLIHT